MEYPNEIYHLSARGNERKAMYRDEADGVRFLDTVEEAATQFAVFAHAHG